MGSAVFVPNVWGPDDGIAIQLTVVGTWPQPGPEPQNLFVNGVESGVGDFHFPDTGGFFVGRCPADTGQTDYGHRVAPGGNPMLFIPGEEVELYWHAWFDVNVPSTNVSWVDATPGTITDWEGNPQTADYSFTLDVGNPGPDVVTVHVYFYLDPGCTPGGDFTVPRFRWPHPWVQMNRSGRRDMVRPRLENRGERNVWAGRDGTLGDETRPNRG